MEGAKGLLLSVRQGEGGEAHEGEERAKSLRQKLEEIDETKTERLANAAGRAIYRAENYRVDSAAK